MKPIIQHIPGVCQSSCGALSGCDALITSLALEVPPATCKHHGNIGWACIDARGLAAELARTFAAYLFTFCSVNIGGRPCLPLEMQFLDLKFKLSTVIVRWLVFFVVNFRFHSHLSLLSFSTGMN